MSLTVEIPGDRTYKNQRLRIGTDIENGLVLDLLDPRTGDSTVLVYLGEEEMRRLLEHLRREPRGDAE